MVITIRFILLNVIAVALAQAEIDVVATFGANPNGGVDNAPALAKAFAYATAHPGTKLHFPCTAGETYLIRSPITFPSHTVIQGDGPSACKIFYNPATNPGSVPAAFSFVNAGYVALRDIMLLTGPSFPPLTITTMGGIHGLASQNLIENVWIQGYATVAMSYSIASEVNTWRNVYWESTGGGAQYGFYTSAQDDFHICSGCFNGSNLALFFANNTFSTWDNSHPYFAIGDKIGGGTADHYYHDLAIGMNLVQGSAAFQFISGTAAQGGPNGVVHVANARIENGGYAFYFKIDAQTTVYNLDIENVTWINLLGQSGFFVYGDNGLMLRDFRMTHNVAYLNGVTGPSSIDSMVECSLDETYGPITIRNLARSNVLTLRGNAFVNLPGNSSQNTVLLNGAWVTR